MGKSLLILMFYHIDRGLPCPWAPADSLLFVLILLRLFLLPGMPPPTPPLPLKVLLSLKGQGQRPVLKETCPTSLPGSISLVSARPYNFVYSAVNSSYLSRPRIKVCWAQTHPFPTGASGSPVRTRLLSFHLYQPFLSRAYKRVQ